MDTAKNLTRVVMTGLLLAGLSAPGGVALAQSFSDFACADKTTPVINAFRAEGSPYKEIEHYCVNQKGKRQGRTRISFSDLSLEFPWSYTEGQYHDGKAVGKWTVFSVKDGEVLGECFFVKGVLKSGDPLCENI
jgi:hypothetical protein